MEKMNAKIKILNDRGQKIFKERYGIVKFKRFYIEINITPMYFCVCCVH